MPKGGLEKSIFITKIWPDAFAFSLGSILNNGNAVFELHAPTFMIIHGIAYYLQVHYCSLFKIGECFLCIGCATVILSFSITIRKDLHTRNAFPSEVC